MTGDGGAEECKMLKGGDGWIEMGDTRQTDDD